MWLEAAGKHRCSLIQRLAFALSLKRQHSLDRTLLQSTHDMLFNSCKTVTITVMMESAPFGTRSLGDVISIG